MVHMFPLTIVLLLVSPVSGTLSGPETVCSGYNATYTCTITGGSTLTWLVGTQDIVSLTTGGGVFGLGERTPIVRAGLEFSFSVLDTSPQLVSQLRFAPVGEFASGIPVNCRGSGNFREAILTMVAAISK